MLGNLFLTKHAGLLKIQPNLLCISCDESPTRLGIGSVCSVVQSVAAGLLLLHHILSLPPPQGAGRLSELCQKPNFHPLQFGAIIPLVYVSYILEVANPVIPALTAVKGIWKH